uniref:Sialate O-acetylesterase domain-containing protein n=1 Tax=Oryza meridionalis TaxID=40149 RepID=A0A0E0DBL2_9ORYZ
MPKKKRRSSKLKENHHCKPSCRAKRRPNSPQIHLPAPLLLTPNASRPAAIAMRIFVLSGQSNMAGRGGVHHRRWDGVVPPECAPCPSVLRLTAALDWVEAREPLHADIDTAKTCGVGPGMAFARAVLPRLDPPGSGVGLVPCAVGGTAIREWARGERLYDQMVRRARAAAECGEIEAVLWYQGESDAESDAATAAYAGNLETLIANVREDLGMPHLPFIQVALASGNKKNIEKVRKAQLGINLPNVVTVDAFGLSLNEDHLHLTTESQVKLGEMLAQAYMSNFLPATC